MRILAAILLRSKLNMGRIGRKARSDEDRSARPGSERTTGLESRIEEMDPRGAKRPLEAYTPRLVGS